MKDVYPKHILPRGRRVPTIKEHRTSPKEPDPDDFDSVKKQFDLASGRARGLWISYLLLVTYLSISLGSITDRMLFLETPIKLPVLNVDLPMNGFFLVGAPLIVVVHVYLLLQLNLLARQARHFGRLLDKFGFEEENENKLRQRIDTFLVSQFIAGPNLRDARRLNIAFSIISWFTMAALPVLVLVSFVLRYLPYHYEPITWWLRFCVVIDVGAIWLFWRGVTNNKPPFRYAKGWGDWINFATSVAIILFVFIAAFPGESHYEFLKKIKILPGFTSINDSGDRNSSSKLWQISLTQYLFEGPINDVHGKTAGLFSNRIIVTDQDFVDDEKIEKIALRERNHEPSADGSKIINSFRGRDLRGAVLDRADLRRSDFTAANLRDASLNGTQLSHSKFNCEFVSRSVPDRDMDRESAPLKCVNADGTDLSNADLSHSHFAGQHGIEISKGISFVGSKMAKTNFSKSWIFYPDFREADLRTVDFSSTYLAAPKFQENQMVDLDFSQSYLHGPTFTNSWIVGTDFSNSIVYEGNISNVSFQYANLSFSLFENSSFRQVYFFESSIDHSFFVHSEFDGFFETRPTQKADSITYIGFGNRKMDPCSPGNPIACSPSSDFDAKEFGGDGPSRSLGDMLISSNFIDDHDLVRKLSIRFLTHFCQEDLNEYGITRMLQPDIEDLTFDVGNGIIHHFGEKEKATLAFEILTKLENLQSPKDKKSISKCNGLQYLNPKQIDLLKYLSKK